MPTLYDEFTSPASRVLNATFDIVDSIAWKSFDNIAGPGGVWIEDLTERRQEHRGRSTDSMPCILISPSQSLIRPDNRGTTGTDHTQYGVTVAFFDVSHEHAEARNRIMLARFDWAFQVVQALQDEGQLSRVSGPWGGAMRCHARQLTAPDDNDFRNYGLYRTGVDATWVLTEKRDAS